MATALQILAGTFGVRSIAPTDPGIQRLAALRSGEYPGLGDVRISPVSEVRQLLGQEPDPLKAYANRPINPFLETTLPALLGAGVGIVGGVGGSLLTKGQTLLAAPPKTGGRMAFADGDSGYFGVSDVFSGIGKALQGNIGQQLLGIGTQALQGYVTQQLSAGGPDLPPFSTAAATPAIVRAGGMMARGLAVRFPTLYAAIQGYLARGINVTRSQLWSLLKRFGPDFLISGGILGAVAVSELMMAGPGRRRMNPGNVKALRKAHRRMKAFHNVCRTNDMLLGSRRRGKPRTSFGGTSITQVK